ncbi:MAG: xanthine dehydrogenase family protein subunit M [Synergistales bacterium]
MSINESTGQALERERSGRTMKVAQHLFPVKIEECIEMLARYGGNARIVAGGTDLFLWLKEGKASAETLVDVSCIKEMKALEERSDCLILGPGLTHAEVASNPVVRRYFPALSDGCRSVGSPQIRNIGTLGGNIVSAQPAADSVVPLVALGAECEIRGLSGSRTELLEELFLGVGKSRVDPTREIITRIILKKPEGKSGNAFARIAPREAMALPVINAAVQLTVEAGRISAARIVTAPVAVAPFRARKAEECLIGKQPGSIGDLKRAAKIAEEEAKPRDSLVRGSGEYRKALVKDLVEQALLRAAGSLG